jgi:hypothetical protein
MSTTYNIRQKLQGIQSCLKAPKTQVNKFGGYKFRNCEDILTAVKPLLSEWGCSLVIQDDIVEVGGRVYVKATASLADNDSEMAISASALAREAETKKGMDEAQITGSASSYARKYALNGLFAIDDTRDPDATNDHGGRVPKPSEAAMEKAQRQHDAKQAGF